MPGNTTFFAKAAQQKITWRDIFSNVFKRHSKEDGAHLFMAGTALTTPHESRMIEQWQKPWLFVYVGLAGLLFIAVMQIAAQTGGELWSIVPVVFVGALFPPLVALLLMWEMNIPRNIPIYFVFAIIFLGGGISFIATDLINRVRPEAAYFSWLSEEPAKLLALCVFMLKPKYKFTLNGILIGGAVGAGFASMETMGYFFLAGSSYDNLLLRGLLSPGGHVVWAAIYGGALAMAKGAGKLRPRHFADKRFLMYFASTCVLHCLWNVPMQIMPLPFVGDVKFVILTVIAWILLLRLIKQGVVQCMQIPQAAAASVQQGQMAMAGAGMPAMAPAMSGGVAIRCLSGAHKGGAFPNPSGRLVIGRDNRFVNVVYPPHTPGISAVHCEVSCRNGVIYLTDKNSSNGTFMADGTRLAPETPHPLSRGSRFYLATRENMFEVE